MSTLRGFGMTFDVGSGAVRNWYIDRDGVKRWADNDELVRGFAGLQDDDQNEPIPYQVTPAGFDLYAEIKDGFEALREGGGE